MAKSKRKRMVEKLDRLAREAVIARDGKVCQKCHKAVSGSDCHASHVLPKSMGYHVRWVVENLKILCTHCHLHWWHKNPLEAGQWFKEKFPGRWLILKDLRLSGDRTKTWRDSDLQEIHDELKAEIQSIRKTNT